MSTHEDRVRAAAGTGPLWRIASTRLPTRLGTFEDRIYSMNPDGSDGKTIVTDCHLPDGIGVDAEAVAAE